MEPQRISDEFDDAFEKRTWSLDTRKELKRWAQGLVEKAMRDVRGCEHCNLCAEHQKHENK